MMAETTTASPHSRAKEKKRETEKSKIVEQDGEYGVMQGDEFIARSNFVLRCVGLVEKQKRVEGFMFQAKPKNNRDDEADEW